tara:strand:- start:148 stop:423 length:276 start_codon:yes stop_codon:yes gene_type:complete
MRSPYVALMAQTNREWRTKEYAGFDAYEVVDYTDGGNVRTVLYRTVGEDASDRASDWLCEHPKATVPVVPPKQGPWQAREPYRHPTNYTGD